MVSETSSKSAGSLLQGKQIIPLQVHFWPLAITFCAEGYVSSRRLRDFLLIKETKPTTKKENDSIEDIKKANLDL
jgi:hypothetical protein